VLFRSRSGGPSFDRALSEGMELVLSERCGVWRFDMDAKAWSAASEASPLSAAAFSRPDHERER
jgi:hypothetical protein